MDTNDVRRAIRRASLLARLGVTALPVVAGNGITESAKQAVDAKAVLYFEDGRKDDDV